MKRVFLGLGSNVGDRESNLNQAIEQLAKNDMIELVNLSSFIETKAVSNSPQPDYLNAVIEIRTLLTPEELMEFTQKVEIVLGRSSKGQGDPRSIDIDILLYDQEIICTEELTIPHPMFHEREFVLKPFNEIAPDVVHPVLELRIDELYTSLVGY